MVEIAEIDSPESLSAWLDAWPRGTEAEQETARKVAVQIAHRAAMRVLPLWWRWSLTAAARDIELTPIPIARSVLISGVAVKVAAPEISTAAAAAAVAARDATRDAAVAGDAIRNAVNREAVYAAIRDALYAACAALDAAYAAADAAVPARDAAARAAAVNWAATRADCASLGKGNPLDQEPLWPKTDRPKGANPSADLWEALCAELDADPVDWSFWEQWYEGALAGNPPDWGLLAEIATQDEAFWLGSAAEVNGRIAEIVARHKAAEAASVELFNATIFDFTFDRLEGVMRAVPLPQDWRHLDDPVLLARFLEDAEDLREGIERLCKALKAEGGGVQGAGAVWSFLEDVLSELDRAHDHRSLRVGTLNELGRFLEAASTDERTLQEFGAILGESLKVNVEKLKELLRNHYTSTLARLAPLRDIRMEEGDEPWKVLQGFREIVAQVRSGADGALPALAAPDAAILDDVLDSVDQKIRSLEQATSEDVRSSLRRDIDFQLAKIGATGAVYRERAIDALDRKSAGKLAKQAGQSTDDFLKWEKRGRGLWRLGKWVLEKLSDAGSG